MKKFPGLKSKTWLSGVKTNTELIAVSADCPPTDAVKYSRFSEVQQEPTSNHNDLN